MMERNTIQYAKQIHILDICKDKHIERLDKLSEKELHYSKKLFILV